MVGHFVESSSLCDRIVRRGKLDGKSEMEEIALEEVGNLVGWRCWDGIRQLKAAFT